MENLRLLGDFQPPYTGSGIYRTGNTLIKISFLEPAVLFMKFPTRGLGKYRITAMLFHTYAPKTLSTKQLVSPGIEYGQEIPQSHTTDQHTAHRGRVTEY